MAAQRELVLALPGHLVAVGHVLRGLPEADRRVHLGHPGADQPPAKPGVGDAGLPRERALRPGQHERRAGHRLRPAGQAHVGLARGDGPGGTGDRLHAGAAQPVHRGTGDLHREAGQQRGHPGGVPVVFPRLVGGSPVHVVDPRRIQPPVAGEQPGDHIGGQVIGADGSERSLDLPHRGTARVHRIDGVGSGPTTPRPAGTGPTTPPNGHGPPPPVWCETTCRGTARGPGTSRQRSGPQRYRIIRSPGRARAA